MDFVRVQITADLHELEARSLDLAVSDQLTRRVGHEGRQTNEENHAPGDLNSEWETPLDGTVASIAAREANPVRHHSSERDAAA